MQTKPSSRYCYSLGPVFYIVTEPFCGPSRTFTTTCKASFLRCATPSYCSINRPFDRLVEAPNIPFFCLLSFSSCNLFAILTVSAVKTISQDQKDGWPQQSEEEHVGASLRLLFTIQYEKIRSICSNAPCRCGNIPKFIPMCVRRTKACRRSCPARQYVGCLLMRRLLHLICNHAGVMLRLIFCSVRSVRVI